MKRNFLTCSILTVAMVLIPLVTMKENSENPITEVAVTTANNGYISVMKSENGKVLSLDTREYIIGVLAAEMDASYHEEALKAQAVAGYTYALYTKNRNLSEELNGADISDDTQVHQGYLSVDERKKKWGENFNEYEEKLGEIADSVAGKAIYFDGKPILAVYHDLNNGKTQSAETVWKRNEPYLLQVESPGDKLSSEYLTIIELSYEEFKSLVKKIDGIEFGTDKEKWIGEVKKTDSGYVKSVDIGGNDVSSQDLRTALNLKSCVFTIECDEDGVTIKTYGNGHMVGMSQYGADYMARQGSDYEEILKYYYSNVEIR